MKGSKRPNRRANRRARREYLDNLDAIALRQIRASYVANIESWGGTRCPGCGISVRPSWIMPWAIHGPGIYMHGQYLACTGIGRSQVKCPGEREWY
jgi:hypothetical protein